MAAVGNWARSIQLVLKAAMWMSAMHSASESEAGQRVRAMCGTFV